VSAPAQLVIFDCDGVLVDTERLSVGVDLRVLAHLGLPMTQDEVIDRFVGRTETFWRAEVERELGREVAAGEFEAFDPWYREAFEADLQPITHVVELLNALDGSGIASCVASSGTHERMRFTLGHTGLYDRFAGRIYSATEVAEGKPSPLLFLHAAEQMGVRPERCVVIEDSNYGVQAAVAAGMPVVGYSGSVTPAATLRAAGADHVVGDLRDVFPIVMGDLDRAR
jgi:HAD superfamily hydrolase (TIGR01509 family)